MLESEISTYFLYLTSSNFVTICHINYWDQTNSWKNFQKIWNGPFWRYKSGSSPYSMFQNFGTVAARKLVPKNCHRYLHITLTTVGGGLVSEFIWGIVDLKVLKISGQVPIKSLFLDHLATKKQDNSKFTMVNLTKIGKYIAFPELTLLRRICKWWHYNT